MDGIRNELSLSTRRDFLRTTAALGIVGGATTETAAQSTETTPKYEIGLPLENEWTFGFADSQAVGGPDIFPGTRVADTYYLRLGETESDPAKIVAYDLQDRSERWELTATTDVSPPVVIDDTLVVSMRSSIEAYPASERSTEALWEYSTDMDFTANPAWGRDGFLIREYNVARRDSGSGDFT